MASVSLIQQLFDTGNVATYTTASFIPNANDHLCAVCCIGAEVSTDWVVTDSLGGAWTKVIRSLRGGSASFMELWVRNTLAAASSMTVTFSHASGNATGGIILVLRTSGMARAGISSIRQSQKEDNKAISTTPSPTFPGSQACLTTNPVIGAVNVLANPAGATPTASPVFTELVDSGYATPATGAEVQKIDSGFTSATVTWGAAIAGGGYGTVVAELDASAVPKSLVPPGQMGRRRHRNAVVIR